MLVLSLRMGEEVILYDRSQNVELGRVKHIKARHPNSNTTPFGFDLPKHIDVIRAQLVEKRGTDNRKDAENDGDKT